MPYTPEILQFAEQVLAQARSQRITLATAESCTGGLVSGALTAVAGASDVFDRAFITYSNEAKQQMLGVTPASLKTFGAVSEAVAKEMAYGALVHSMADIAVSVTGVAGPDGGTDDKPVGLVCFGVAKVGQPPEAFTINFGDVDRATVRMKSVRCALNAFHKAL